LTERVFGGDRIMTVTESYSFFWSNIAPKVLSNLPHKEISIPIEFIPNPTAIGAHQRPGDFKGQSSDYGITLQNGEEIHLRKYPTEYRIHWDIISPSVDWLEHLRLDAPHWYVTLIFLGAFGLGLGIGYLVDSQ